MDEQHKSRGGLVYWLGRRSRRFWILVVAILPLLYVASVRPACRLAERGSMSIQLTARIYRPLFAVICYGPDQCGAALLKYARLFTKPRPSRTAVGGKPSHIIWKLYDEAYPLTYDDLASESTK